jgi:MFS family permease
MNIKKAPAGTIRAALAYPAFRGLVSALAVSQLGDWLYNLTLIALVYGRTHSAWWAGVTTAARVVPVVLLGPLGGVIADRFDRRRVMIASDVTRMALMVLLAAVAVVHLPILLAPVIAAAATAAAAPYLPCVSAITPRLVQDADLPGANAARSAVNGLAVIAGPALGGLLLLLGSPALAFMLNALTFGLSALAVTSIRGRAVFRPEPADGRPAGVFRQVAQGAAVLRSHSRLMRLVGADIACSTVYGTQIVLLLLVSHRIGLGSQGYGYMFAGIGAGGLIGTVLAGRAVRCPHARYVLAAALTAVGLPMPLLALVRWPAAAIFLAGLTGTGALLVEILTETQLQRSLDDEVFGRVYGIALPASLGGIVVGSLIAPVLVAVIGGSGALLLVGGAVLAYALFILREPAAGTAAAAMPQPEVTRALVGVQVTETDHADAVASQQTDLVEARS